MANQNVLDLAKATAPLLAVLAAIIRLVPTLVTSTKSRSRARSSSPKGLRVRSLTIDPPWENEPWPEKWDSIEERKKFRRSERFWIVVLFASSLVLAAVYFVIFYDDRFSDVITFHQGNGIPAAVAGVIFTSICVVQVCYFWRIRGDKGLGDTLYGAAASVIVEGDLAEIRQYCLGALYETGSKVVSCRTADTESDRQEVVLVAATGFWPPRWLNLGPLKLISIRGQRILVGLRPQDEGHVIVDVKSDNMDPGVDESRRANKRNVQGFVDSWAFFPGDLRDRTPDGG